MWLRVNRLQLPLLSSSTYGFFNNSISQNSKNVNTKNNTGKGVDIKYSISDDVIKKFEIENINDYVHVQKQVLSTLNAENFFDDEGEKSKTVINKDSGMVIVINKKGIKETFNNKNYFNYSRNLKLAKLASIRKIPELIENGKLILDDEKNYHRNNSSIKYAYIVCETKINGKNANIKITVRKSPQNNKFWVHHIYIEKGTERTSAGTSKSSKTAFIPFGATNSISENRNNVNTKNDESSNDIKYSMGGLKAETADKSALEKAMELEKDGTDSEKIRKETGWFKGYDGKWRFEIDNSELEFKTDIEKNRAAAIELAKMKVKSAELEEKIVNDTATKAEENVQTMYSGKNKESLATTPSENKSLSQTSETLSGTASYKILAHEGNKVNIKENDNISDIKYATDDTINDWLDDESTPQGIDYEKAVEKNPVIEEITMQSREKTIVPTLTGTMLCLLIAVNQGIHRMKTLCKMTLKIKLTK